ncbi:hypothetical protein CDAR_75101 [Caerostris darwini]|uniref:Uncharacterized protein n=1 Tax=Caerostris darwini TaxID=1538125 RepID=A0AAV4MS60_9ARAC|nr:hypothetical protein CDAR_75101 [Caerostris darwini]
MEPGDKPEDLDDGRGFLRYIYEGHVNDRDYCVSESTSPLGQRVTTLNSDRESDKWPGASLNGSRDLFDYSQRAGYQLNLQQRVGRRDHDLKQEGVKMQRMQSGLHIYSIFDAQTFYQNLLKLIRVGSFRYRDSNM